MSHPDPNGDYALLERWSQGEKEAGNELIEKHLPVVYRFLRTKLDAGIDDVVQATMLALIEKRHTFRGKSSFRTFLLAMARFELYRHYRNAARDSKLDLTTQSAVDLGRSPSSALAHRDEEHVLQSALCRLPVELQIALELAYWEDLSGPDIALVLDIPLNTAYSRLRRAKELLRDQLGRLQGVELGDTPTDLDRWAELLRQQLGRN